MMKRTSLCGLILAGVAYLSPSERAFGQKMYWTDAWAHKIQRANLDGTDVEDIVTARFISVAGVAVDSHAQKVYWIDQRLRSIQRGNTDLTEIENVVVNIPRSYSQTFDGIALDPVGGFLYWATSLGVWRSDLDGNSPEQIISDLGGSVRTSIDADTEQVCWAIWNSGIGGRIFCAESDGSDIHEVFSTTGWVGGIAIDSSNGTIYWQGSCGICNTSIELLSGEVPSDRTDIQVVAPTAGSSGGLAFDETTRFLYWNERIADDQFAVRRIHVETGLTNTVAPLGKFYLRGIAIDTVSSMVYSSVTTTTVISEVSIWRASVNGDIVESFGVPAGLRPNGIVLDSRRGQLYWSENMFSVPRVQRSNLNGTNIALVANHWSSDSLALEPERRSLYWTSKLIGTHRLDLNSLRVDSILGGTTEARIAIDLTNEMLYWADTGCNLENGPCSPSGYIYRTDLDGLDFEFLVLTDAGRRPVEIVVDPAKEQFYWTERTDGVEPGQIMRANLDGTAIEEVVGNLVDPYGIALDTRNETLYWTDRELGVIFRADTNGQHVGEVVTGLNSPRSIVLDLVARGQLDIRPGSCPNPVNPKSRGVVSVAIVGSPTLDVREIDVSSVELGRADGEGSAVVPGGNGNGKYVSFKDVSKAADTADCLCSDSGGDGIEDLVLKFSSESMTHAFDLASFDPKSPLQLTLRGVLFDGTDFTASDCIRIVGRAIEAADAPQRARSQRGHPLPNPAIRK